MMLLLLGLLSAGAIDFSELLAGKHCPLSIKLGELDKKWRRFTIHSSGTASGNISVSVTGSGGNSGSSQNNVADLSGSRKYLTTGQTVNAGGRVYLVAYRFPGGELNLPGLIQAIATKSPPISALLTPDSILPLCLLDLASLGSLDDIQAFELDREIAESNQLFETIQSALKSAGGNNDDEMSNSPEEESPEQE